MNINIKTLGKRVVSWLFALILGYLAAVIFIGIFLTILSLLSPFSLFILFSDFAIASYPLIILVFIILSLWEWKKNGYFFRILKPTATNICLAALIALFWSLISFLKSSGKLILFNPFDNTVLNAVNVWILIIPAFISTFFFLYPFSAFIIKLKKSFEKNSSRRGKLFLVLILTLINPISISYCLLLITDAAYQYGLTHRFLSPCGAMIVSVKKDSPAYKAGLEPGEIIQKVNQSNIQSKQDALDFINNQDSTNEITITSQLKTYKLIIYIDPVLNRYSVGLTLSDGYCKK